jgi:hypothetical protein
VCCVLFERSVLFCVMCVICVLRLIVVSLPPGKNPFAVKIIIIIIMQEIKVLKHIRMFCRNDYCVPPILSLNNSTFFHIFYLYVSYDSHINSNCFPKTSQTDWSL